MRKIKIYFYEALFTTGFIVTNDLDFWITTNKFCTHFYVPSPRPGMSYSDRVSDVKLRFTEDLPCLFFYTPLHICEHTLRPVFISTDGSVCFTQKRIYLQITLYTLIAVSANKIHPKTQQTKNRPFIPKSVFNYQNYEI